jgi:pilus assembly protein CpaB
MEMSKVFLENIQVLAAGQNVASDDAGRPLNVQVVTLLVTPQQSEALALASVDGRIQLALRNPLDLEETNPNAVRREHLFAGIGAATVAPPTPAPKPAARPAPRRVETKTAVVAPPPPPVAPPPPPPPVPAVPVKREIQVISGNRIDKVTFESKENSGQ